MTACGSGERKPICAAEDTLRSALQTVELARAADQSADAAAVRRHMDDVDRLLRIARAQLAASESDPKVGAAARGMLEAAGYLEFMVGDYRSSGVVDFALTQFAFREINRAVAGGGGAPLNC